MYSQFMMHGQKNIKLSCFLILSYPLVLIHNSPPAPSYRFKLCSPSGRDFLQTR